MSQLVRDELRLAQLEVSGKAKKAGLGVGMFGVAGLLALYGVGALIATAILALAVAMDAWLAALIVAVVLLAGSRCRSAAGEAARRGGRTASPDQGRGEPQAGRGCRPSPRDQ